MFLLENPNPVYQWSGIRKTLVGWIHGPNFV